MKPTARFESLAECARIEPDFVIPLRVLAGNGKAQATYGGRLVCPILNPDGRRGIVAFPGNDRGDFVNSTPINRITNLVSIHVQDVDSGTTRRTSQNKKKVTLVELGESGSEVARETSIRCEFSPSIFDVERVVVNAEVLSETLSHRMNYAGFLVDP